MPKTVNNQPVMTSQEWLQLGYPMFVASALEELNTASAEEGDSQLTVEQVRQTDTEDLMGLCMSWEGIIGYTSRIIEAVRKLDAR